MPFTPAHTAIVLPFIKSNRRFLSATGLIIGSVTPDFEYFFKMSVSGEHSHTIPGLFYFDLPVGFFLALIFHEVIKKRFIRNLPSVLQARLQPLASFDFIPYVKSNAVVFGFSLMLGAASHIFWDGFTHYDGFFVRRLSFYEGSYVPFEGVKYPLWYALQHISTFTGLFIVAVYVAFMKPFRTTIYDPSIAYWIFIVAIAVLILFIRFGFWPDHLDLGNFVVSSISAICMAFLLAGLIPIRTRTHG